MTRFYKECKFCQEPFEKMGTVSIRKWEKRLFCSTRCRGRSIAKNPYDEKYLRKEEMEIREVVVPDKAWNDFIFRFTLNCGGEPKNKLSTLCPQ